MKKGQDSPQGNKKNASSVKPEDIYSRAWLADFNEMNFLEICAELDMVAKNAKGTKLASDALAQKAKLLSLYAKEEYLGSQKAADKQKALALKVAKQAIKVNPKDEEENLSAALTLVTAAKLKGNPDSIAEKKQAMKPLLESFRSKNPISMEDHLAMSKALWIIEGREASIAHLQSLTKQVQFKIDYRLFAELANELKKADRLDEAVEAFDEATRLQPRYAMGHFYKARSLMDQGDYIVLTDQSRDGSILAAKKFVEAEEAIKLTRKILEENNFPVSADVYILHSQIMRSQQNPQTSLEIALEGLKLYPDNYMLHDGASASYAALPYASDAEYAANLRKSIEHDDAIISVRGKDIHTLVNKAFSLSILGEVDEAIECMTEASNLMQRSKKHKEEYEKLDVKSQAFVDKALSETLPELMSGVNKLKALCMDRVAEDGEEWEVALAKKINSDIEAAKAKALEVKAAALKAATSSESTDGELKANLAKVEEAGNLGENASMEAAIYAKYKALKAQSTQLSEYMFGLTHTFESIFTASKAASSGTLNIEVDNPVSKLSCLASFLPFGGEVASKLISTVADNVKAGMVRTKLGNIAPYAPTDIEGSYFAISVAVDMASNHAKQVSGFKPKVKSNFTKFKEGLGKIVKGDIDHYTYKTPHQLLGHAHAQAAIKEMSLDMKISKLNPNSDSLVHDITEYIVHEAEHKSNFGTLFTDMAHVVESMLMGAEALAS